MRDEALKESSYSVTAIFRRELTDSVNAKVNRFVHFQKERARVLHTPLHIRDGKPR